MATNTYEVTNETRNFVRLARLIVDICADLLRAVLETRVKLVNFQHTLISLKEKIIRHLNAKQRGIVYPRGYFKGTYSDFDISLLYVLLRHIGNIQPPQNTWGVTPDNSDRSLAANIERIHIAKNDLYSHIQRASISDSGLGIAWKKLSLTVTEIEQYCFNGQTHYSELCSRLLTEHIDQETILTYIDKMADCQNKICKVEIDVANVKDDAKKLQQDMLEVGTMKDEVKELHQEVTDISSMKDDVKKLQQEVTDLSIRMDALTNVQKEVTEVGSMKDVVKKLQQEVTDLSIRMDALTDVQKEVAEVGSVKDGVKKLQQEVTGLSIRMGALADVQREVTEVGSIKDGVKKLQQEVTDLSTKVVVLTDVQKEVTEVDSMKDGVKKLQQEVTELGIRINTLTDVQKEVAEVGPMKDGVKKLQQEVTDLGIKMDVLTDVQKEVAEVGPMKDGVKKLQQEVTDLGIRMDTLTDVQKEVAEVGPMKDGVKKLQQEVTDLGIRMDTLTDVQKEVAEVGPMKGGVKKLQQEVTDLSIKMDDWTDVQKEVTEAGSIKDGVKKLQQEVTDLGIRMDAFTYGVKKLQEEVTDLGIRMDTLTGVQKEVAEVCSIKDGVKKVEQVVEIDLIEDGPKKLHKEAKEETIKDDTEKPCQEAIEVCVRKYDTKNPHKVKDATMKEDVKKLQEEVTEVTTCTRNDDVMKLQQDVANYVMMDNDVKRRQQGIAEVPSIKNDEEEDKGTVTSSRVIFPQSQVTQNIIDNTLGMLERHKHSKTFVRTRTVDEGLKVINTFGIVIFTGEEGEGKTTNALEVMNFLYSTDANYVLLELDSVEDWDVHVNINVKTVVFLDNFLDSSRSNFFSKDKHLRSVQACIDKGQVKVVATARSTTIHKHRHELQKHLLFDERHFIDLSVDKNCLSTKTKESILKRFCKYFDIRICHNPKLENYNSVNALDSKKTIYISKDTCLELAECKPFIGFPQMCFLYCSNRKYARLGKLFFQQPLQKLMNEMNSMRKSKDSIQNIQFCVLLYICFNFTLDINEINYDLMDKICKCLYIDRKLRMEQIDEALDDMKEVYVVQKPQTSVYVFKHLTLSDAAALSLSKHNLRFLLEHCNTRFIENYIKPETYQQTNGEVVVIIRRHLYRIVAKTIICELSTTRKSSGVRRIMQMSVFADEEIRTTFFDLLQSDCKNYEILKRVFFDSFCNEDVSMIEQYYKSDTLKKLLKIGPFVKRMCWYCRDKKISAENSKWLELNSGHETLVTTITLTLGMPFNFSKLEKVLSILLSGEQYHVQKFEIRFEGLSASTLEVHLSETGVL